MQFLRTTCGQRQKALLERKNSLDDAHIGIPVKLEAVSRNQSAHGQIF